MSLVGCVGLASHDLIMSVSALPVGPGKIHATHRVESGGGPAANAAAAISRLGGSSRLITAVGSDQLGDKILSDLASIGVDVSRARRVPDTLSPLSSITVDESGERSIVNHTDHRTFASAAPVDDQDLEGVGAVLADIRWHSGSESALTWALDRGVPGVLDYDLGNPGAWSLLSIASHVVFSEPALAQLTGTENPDQSLADLSRTYDLWMAVTLGASGTVWRHQERSGSAPSPRVEAVDTTGAGDVYHGVFALELSRGQGEEAAIGRASAAAALSCTRYGGRDGVPFLAELDSFIRINK
jgi:sulfofructose kinase